MNTLLKESISDSLRMSVTNATPVSGGDISSAYIIENEVGKIFCKVNYGSAAFEMFLAEKEGLQIIAESQTLKVPEVFACQNFGEGAFLVMEYIPKKLKPTAEDYAEFGKQLARMHRLKGIEFGWQQDNFIGNLPQANQQHAFWDTFYVEERLVPQLTLAIENGYFDVNELPSMQKLLSVCRELMEHVEPSLIHGDLWSGNYLISEKGQPYVIDPAFYYGHGEVDLAMSKLFGGFPEAVYDAYYQLSSPMPGHEERKEIYQLYYLLVHLNLFGKSYYRPVKRILDSYFS